MNEHGEGANVRTKCFAYVRDRNACAICNELICGMQKTCKFYKTQQQLSEERMKSAKRLLQRIGEDHTLGRRLRIYGLDANRLEEIARMAHTKAGE